MKHYAAMHSDSRVIAEGDFLECCRKAQKACPTPPGHGADYFIVSECGYKALFQVKKIEEPAA